ncbi:M13 family metallopeptidase [Luteimonas pelagia]
MPSTPRRVLPALLSASIGLALALPTAAAAKDAKACEDFDAHANAAWYASHPEGVPASAMGELAARADAQVAQLLQGAMSAPQGPLETWLGHLYAGALDDAAIERAGTTAIAPLLAEVDKVRRARHVAPAIATLHRAGIPVVVDTSVGPSGDTLAVALAQGGLGLGDPAFYTRDGAEAEALRGKYRAYVQRMLELGGMPAAEAAAQAQVVLDVETRIAATSRPLSLLRAEPARGRESLSVSGLDRQYPRLQPASLLQAAGSTSAQVMADPQWLAKVEALAGEIEPAQWRSYLRFHVADAMAPSLPKAWRDAHFAFHGPNLEGRVRAPDAAARATLATQELAPHVLGQAYAARYLSPADADRARGIATRVRDAFAQAVPGAPALDATARAAAQSRLATLQLEIGAAGPAIDATTLPALDRANHAANVLAARAWRQARSFARAGQPSGSAATVPAWRPVLAWLPDANRLVATPAVLQAPVFDASQPPPAQYGALGAMLGHELSHAAGVEAMAEPANRLVAQYVAFPIPEAIGVAYDSRRTAAEQMADLAGVELALAAHAAAEPGADAAATQAFARGWAGLWPQRLAPAQAQAAARGSAHPPGYWRVNGPLRNQPAFATAFECKAKDAMSVDADARVGIWK